MSEPQSSTPTDIDVDDIVTEDDGPGVDWQSSIPPIDVDAIVTEDDTPVDNLFSEKQQRLLTEPLYSSWIRPTIDASDPQSGRRTFLVAANVGLFPSVHKPGIVPDVFLSLDVEVAKDLYDKSHRSYFFWEFGKAPEVVIEIVSNRKGNELGSKLSAYARMRVLHYIVYDPTMQLGDVILRTYQLGPLQYQLRTESALPGIGLGLVLWDGVYEGTEAKWLRWCDESGVLIPTGAEKAEHANAQAKHEAERAEREAERAKREAQRSELLAAKLRAAGIDPDEE